MRRFLALAAVPVMIVATACSGDSSKSDASPTTSSTTSTTPAAGSVADVHVNLSGKGAPKADFPKPFSVSTTQVKVVDQGTGPKVNNGDTVLSEVVAYNGTTAVVFDNTYVTGSPEAFALVDQRMLPGIISGLVGQNVGSTVVLAVPPADAFSTQGNQQFGIQPTDSIVFVMKIEQVSDPNPLAMATGKASPLPATVPDLKLDSNGQPTGFVSTGKEIKVPTKLGVYTPIQGTGPKLKKGDLATLQYIGQIYPDGTVFDESWSTGPRVIAVDVPLIKGWIKGLVGQRVGSRVVLVVPPDFGYGDKGQSAIHVTGTTRLIFEIDILGVGRS